MKHLLNVLLFMLLLTACTATPTAPSVTPSPSPTPVAGSDTPNPPPTLSPTQTRVPQLTVTPSPTLWPTPTPELSPTYFFENYPLKQVWIKYGAGGSCCSGLDNIDPIFNFPISTFVIYSDNEIILSHQGSPILEKKLSNTEVCQILNNITYLGLDKYNGLGDNPDDSIYTANAKDNWSSDGVYYRLTVNGDNPRFLHIYDSVSKFIIQPVKTLRNYLEKYQPIGMKPYIPDRLAGYVVKGRDLFENPEKLVAIPWPTDVTPLSKTVHNDFYLEGKAAALVYDLFKGADKMLFIDQDVEYSVLIRPILPDETDGSYQEATSFTPSYQCK